jgi:intraflagellar transport protein 80
MRISLVPPRSKQGLICVAQGKLMQQSLNHTLDVIEVGISQFGPALERKIYVLDRNHDLYVASANVTKTPNPSGQNSNPLIKIASMVDCALWHDSTEMLAAVSDGKIVVWYYPNVVFVDKDITVNTKEVHDADGFGKTPRFVSFTGSRITTRRTDGTLIVTGLSPYPAVLYEHVSQVRYNPSPPLDSANGL